MRTGVLIGLESWLRERFLQHRGNADVVRQGLARGRRQRVLDRQHLAGIVGVTARTVPDRALLRPLADYAMLRSKSNSSRGSSSNCSVLRASIRRNSSSLPRSTLTSLRWKWLGSWRLLRSNQSTT